MNQYALLSEIYRLLSDVTVEDIDGALRYEVSPEIRSILEAFRAATIPRTIVEPPPLPPALAGHLSHEEGPLDFLLDEAYGYADIASILKRSGLTVSGRSKDGKKKLIKDALGRINAIAEPRRMSVLMSIRRHAGAGDTAGWMKVIGATKP